MYESHWHLERKPFEPTSGAANFWPGEGPQGALLKLRYAIENRRQAALLTGPSGVGKTTLVRVLFNTLPENFRPKIHLVFPEFSSVELLAYLVNQLDADWGNTPHTPPPQQSVSRFEQILSDTASAGQHAVIVIDESQGLVNTGTLETLRLLLNLEPSDLPAMTLLLVGQTALVPALERMPELEDRLAVKCLLRSLTEQETAEYVHHRLAESGRTDPLFTDQALVMLHHLSQGIPRKIDRLGDLALLVGYAEELDQIDEPQITAVHEELVAVWAE